MRYLLALLLFTQIALAQAPSTVRQSGVITQGHGVRWVTNGIIGDAGTAANPLTTSLGAMPGPICVNSAAVTAPYNSICLSATTGGGGKISVTNHLGSVGGLSLELNGVSQSFLTIPVPLTGDTVYSALGTSNTAAFVKQWANVRAWGALGGGVDDTVAFQNAINYIATLGGGIVYVPPGYYCLNSGVSWNSPGVRIMGSSHNGTVISTCYNDVTLFTMNGSVNEIHNVFLIGKGANFDTGTFGATAPTIVLETNCIHCNLMDVMVYGGKYAVWNKSGEAFSSRFSATHNYGSAIWYSTGGQWLNRPMLDTFWVAATPTYPIAMDPWAASTVYATGAVVSNAGYYLQATTGGTSGGTLPTLRNYLLNITDNTVIWQLLGPTASYGLQLDTGSAENYVHQLDATGPQLAAVGMTNTLAGAPPGFFKCIQCIFSQTYSYGIDLRAGSGVFITDSSFGSCYRTGCTAMSTQNDFAGKVSITGGAVGTGSDFGLTITQGTNYTVQGVHINQATTGILLSGTATNIVINGNIIEATTHGVSISGSVNYYNVVNNICGPSTADCVFGDPGAIKTISGNLGN